MPLEDNYSFPSIRIVVIDHLLLPPGPLDRSIAPFRSLSINTGLPPELQKLKLVPVIRIFGPLKSHQRACIHVHGVFPYLMVPYKGDPRPHILSQFIERFALAVNAALSLPARTTTPDPLESNRVGFIDQLHTSSNQVHVAAITPIQALPFYGYHPNPIIYLKIYLVDPNAKARLALLLASGAILHTVMQPHEAHLPFYLQFLADHGLDGMGWMNLSWALARPPLQAQVSQISSLSPVFLPPSMQWNPQFPCRRTTYCHLEADTHASAICNYYVRRNNLASLSMSSLSTQYNPNSDSPIRLIPSLKSLWDEEANRRDLFGLPPYDQKQSETRLDEESFSYTDFMDEHYKSASDIFFRELERDKGPSFREPLPDQGFPWIQDSVPDLWPISFHPNLAKTTVCERGYAPRDSDVLPSGGQSSEICTYPDLIKYSQFTMSQMTSSSQEPGIPSLTQEVSEIDVQLTQMVLQYSNAEDENNWDEEEKQIMSESDENEDDLWLHPASLDSDINIDSATHTSSIPISDFDMDDGRSISIPQYDGAGDSDASIPEMAEHKNYTQDEFRRIPLDLLSYSSIIALQRKKNSVLSIPSNINAITNISIATWPSSPVDGQPTSTSIRSDWQLLPAAQLLDDTKSSESDSNYTHTELLLTPNCDRFDMHDQILQSSSKDRSCSKITSDISASNVIFNSDTPMNHSSKSVCDLETTKVDFKTIFYYIDQPPSIESSEWALLADTIPLQIHQKPFYGDSSDAKLVECPHSFAGRTYRIPLLLKHDNCSFSSVEQVIGMNMRGPKLKSDIYMANESAISYKSWTYAIVPPSAQDAVQGIDVESKKLCLQSLNLRPAIISHKHRKRKRENATLSRLESMPGGITQVVVPKFSQQSRSGRIKATAKDLGEEPNALLCLGVETHVNTRGDYLPDPHSDALQAIFYVFYSDTGVPSTGQTYSGVLIIKDHNPSVLDPQNSTYFESEAEMIQGLVDLVRMWDPDAILGYEIHSASWGYILERCRYIYEYDLSERLSRAIEKRETFNASHANQWGIRKAAPFSITGRLVLNVWRLLRSELSLSDYSLESVVQEVLKRRMPRYSAKVLTTWYSNSRTRRRVIEFGVQRVVVTMQLIVTGGYLDRTAEFARLYGIDFMSVLSRGSQFKVEAVMSRLVRSMGFCLISPTRKQVASQRAAECLALTMEPESAFYTDPVLVLDFQSLYPSVIISRNMCYCTCLGKLTKEGKHSSKLGCISSYEFPKSVTQDQVWISPNGVMFLKFHNRRSLLAKVLTELLDTRVMVKKSMSLYRENAKGKDDYKELLLLLEMRQLGLKLLANVIYGYTAASFSGRMPMVELADSVVQTGRMTLEHTISHIHATPKWGGRVVYGDTDSVFVEVKGATMARAFHIGRSITEAISQINPFPIYLKFEKVYLPCILAAKKRYVGHKFESIEDINPVFDAKGIETVRRDGCPATSKLLRTALEILFVQRDVSKVKSYICRQFTKLLEGRVPLKDLIIAKEVKLGTYSNRTLPPPGAYLSLQKMNIDPQTEPQYGERVPYVVAYGAPGDRLIDQVMCPRNVLNHGEFRVNAHYYILRQIIPALSRLFQLIGANVGSWYSDLPKPIHRAQDFSVSQSSKSKRITIEHYYALNHCSVCKEKLSDNYSSSSPQHTTLCTSCNSKMSGTAKKMILTLKNAEMRHSRMAQICEECSSSIEAYSECEALCCPVLYDRIKSASVYKSLVKVTSDLGLITSADQPSK